MNKKKKNKSLTTSLKSIAAKAAAKGPQSRRGS